LGGLNIFKFNSLDLRADYNMWQNRLTCYGAFRSFNASGGTNITLAGAALLGVFKIDYSKSQIDFGGRFTITQRQYLVMDVSWINFKDRGGYTNNLGVFVANSSFKDYSFRARYEFQF